MTSFAITAPFTRRIRPSQFVTVPPHDVPAWLEKEGGIDTLNAAEFILDII